MDLWRMLQIVEKEFNCKIVTVDTLTEGAACTVLLTKKLII